MGQSSVSLSRLINNYKPNKSKRSRKNWIAKKMKMTKMMRKKTSMMIKFNRIKIINKYAMKRIFRILFPSI